MEKFDIQGSQPCVENVFCLGLKYVKRYMALQWWQFQTWWMRSVLIFFSVSLRITEGVSVSSTIF